MNAHHFATQTRNNLRSIQSTRISGDGRIDKSLKEVILGITWRVAEKISGQKLPR